MFELGQTPFHTPVIPSLWDEVLQLILSFLELEGTCKSCVTLLLLKLVVMIVGYFKATFSQKHLSWRESNVSVNIPL